MAYKVYLALIENPKTWRAIIVPNSYTFSDLHISIQSVMGWSNTHLYEFKLCKPENGIDAAIGVPDEYCEVNRSFMDSRKTRLSEVFSGPILYAKYVYDFGDYWEHWLKIIEVADIAEYTQLPVHGEMLLTQQPAVGIGRHNAFPTRNCAKVQVAGLCHHWLQRACYRPEMHGYANDCSNL